MTVEEAYKKVDEVADNLGMPIDEGIKKTVVGLWANGIETTGSCQGHRKHGEPFPWIDVEMPDPDEWEHNSAIKAAWKKANSKQRLVLQKLLDEFNKAAEFPYPLTLIPRGIYGAVRLQTGRTKSIVDMIPPNFLDELQRQMNAFADFLLNNNP